LTHGIIPPALTLEELVVAASKGLKKPVKLKSDLAEFCGAKKLPRTEITKKLWDYIKKKKLQTSKPKGKPENAGRYVVADAKLLPVFRNTNSVSKSGNKTDLRKMKEGDTIDMMQMAAVVSANVDAD
jgi:chromatin remodeling complex protein RSC6